MTPAILAIDTATEQCSVALHGRAQNFERVVPTARGHADIVLSLVDEVLRESALELGQLRGLAFGRGPGSFTGVRIAVGVIQGLSLSSGLPVVGISNLAAVAQRAALEQSLLEGERLLICMDARMHEVYCAVYELSATGLVQLVGDERVTSPDAVQFDADSLCAGAGTGWRAYPKLRERFPRLAIADAMLPRAREIALLSVPEFASNRGSSAAQAEPVYLRDQVAWAAQERP